MISIVKYILVIILILQTNNPVFSEQRSDLKGIWSELVIRSAKALDKECPACMKFVATMMSEDALRASRLESIKKSILEGLGMSEPPKINVADLSIPFPIKNGDILKNDMNDDGTDNEDLDSNSNHPSKVIVVATDNSIKETENGFEVSFKLEMPWNVHSGELTGAILWLFTESETNGNVCNMFSKPCSSHTFDYSNEIFIEAVEFKDGWTQFDITSPINYWLEYEEFCQRIRINCNGPVMSLYQTAFLNESENKPFITVNISPFSTVNRNRNKRNINCVASSTECCRERLLVSFSQLQWDNWIIQPPSYEAYYCKGKCEGVASLSLGSTPYNSVLHKLRMNTELVDKLPEIRPCCAPTQLSSLQIIYVNQNGTFLKSTIPNMSVVSCGCT